MRSLLNFLFGKSPSIFTKQGEVCHHLGSNCWKNWRKRYQNSNEHNWKNHKGTRQPPTISDSNISSKEKNRHFL